MSEPDYKKWQERMNRVERWSEAPRLVRYRRSPNGIYQEVLLENGHYFYGIYMPEGFVPPEGMEDEC